MARYLFATTKTLKRLFWRLAVRVGFLLHYIGLGLLLLPTEDLIGQGQASFHCFLQKSPRQVSCNNLSLLIAGTVMFASIEIPPASGGSFIQFLPGAT
jgi:uncharacterized membrane-anchored protein YitT (DUF2179 family)